MRLNSAGLLSLLRRSPRHTEDTPHPHPQPGQVLSLWTPPELPCRGAVRADDECFADFLPVDDQDFAPWRLRYRDGRRPAIDRVTHQVVYAAGWKEIGNLHELTAAPARRALAAAPPSLTPASTVPEEAAVAGARVFGPGSDDPGDLAAVIDSMGKVWPASDWTHGAISWPVLTELFSPLIEVPAARLLAELTTRLGLTAGRSS